MDRFRTSKTHDNLKNEQVGLISFRAFLDLKVQNRTLARPFASGPAQAQAQAQVQVQAQAQDQAKGPDSTLSADSDSEQTQDESLLATKAKPFKKPSHVSLRLACF